MKNTTIRSFSYHSPGESASFERNLITIVCIVAAMVLIYLGIKGPMFLSDIVYKTHPTINNQLIAQDAVNTFVIAPILLIAAFALLMKRKSAKYLLTLCPLFMIYYALSYGLGWEWMAPGYSGNSEQWFFCYLYVLIAAILILLYSFRLFPDKARYHFNKKGLVLYSILCTVFLLLFGLMWVKEVFEVMQTGTSRSYELAPTAFWLVRLFDLGFSIPLGLISIYLLWFSPAKTLAIQMLFFGFFVTMSIVVNAMALVMWINHDPSFEIASSAVFAALLVIVFAGYFYVLKGYNTSKRRIS